MKLGGLFLQHQNLIKYLIDMEIHVIEVGHSEQPLHKNVSHNTNEELDNRE